MNELAGIFLLFSPSLPPSFLFLENRKKMNFSTTCRSESQWDIIFEESKSPGKLGKRSRFRRKTYSWKTSTIWRNSYSVLLHFLRKRVNMIMRTQMVVCQQWENCRAQKISICIFPHNNDGLYFLLKLFEKICFRAQQWARSLWSLWALESREERSFPNECLLIWPVSITH